MKCSRAAVCLSLGFLLLANACKAKPAGGKTSGSTSAGGTTGSSSGGGSSGGTTGVQQQPTPPDAPLLTATAANGQVTLNWNSVSDAVSYTVQGATVSAGPYTTLATVTTTNYTDTSVEQRQAYYYVVQATSAVPLTSASSNEAAATPYFLNRWGQDHSSYDLYSLVYGNGVLVAGSIGGWLLVSSDGGVTWVDHYLGESSITYGLGYGNGLFVATTTVGSIFTSPDGDTWTRQVSPVTTSLNTVVYGNGLYLAAGDDGVVLASSDGVVWNQAATVTYIDSGAATQNMKILGAAYGFGAFVLVGTSASYDFGYIRVANELALANWSAPAAMNGGSAADPQTPGRLSAVTYGTFKFASVQSTFLASGDSGTFAFNNGDNWYTQTVGAGTDQFDAIAANSDGQVELVGHHIYRCDVAVCSAGVNGWAQDTAAGSADYLFGAAYDGANFFAVGSDGLVVSEPKADTTWVDARRPGHADHLFGLATHDEVVVTAGTSGFALLSTDGGASFNPVDIDTASDIYTLFYFNDRFVAAGFAGIASTSSDGQHWTSGNRAGRGELLLFRRRLADLGHVGRCHRRCVYLARRPNLDASREHRSSTQIDHL